MLDKADLDNVTTIITHGGCPDGIASAILLADSFTGAKVVFMKHGTREFEELKPTFGMLFCDIAPPKERAKEFFDVGAIVLDHHEKQRDVVEMFGPRGIYGCEPGVSGAVLAFREVWARTSDPEVPSYARAAEFARIAGVRDTWQTQSQDWITACAQAEALRFYPWEYFARIDAPFHPTGFDHLTQLLNIGGILLEKRAEQVSRAIKESHRVITRRGTRLVVIPTIQTSDVAEAIDDAADLVIGFAYHVVSNEEIRCTLSMRSHTGYDVGEFCKALGGGGHRSAAGCTLPITSSEIQPYAMIQKIVEDHERCL